MTTETSKTSNPFPITSTTLPKNLVILSMKKKEARKVGFSLIWRSFGRLN